MNQEKLLAPFPLDEHKWRIGSKSKAGDKARALVYIDARNVMDRMDEVFGNDLWHASYDVLKQDDVHWVVQCTIKATLPDGRAVIKTDVGEGTPSFSGTLENVCKEAYSDSLKRAAVHFGIGRYLYGLTYEIYLPIEYNRFTKQSMSALNGWLAQQLGAPAPKQQPKQDDNPFEPAVPSDSVGDMYNDPMTGIPDDSAAHMGQPEPADTPSPPTPRTDAKLTLLRELRDKAASGTAASAGQYQFLSGTIDKMFGGADVHKEVLSAIIGTPVNSTDRPSKAFTGFLLNKLLEQHKPQGSNEWMPNPKFDPIAVDMVKGVYAKVFNQNE